jgi:hypothetical protein
MLSDDELRAVAETALRIGVKTAAYRSSADILANITGTAAAVTPKAVEIVPPLPVSLTRAEIAEYIACAGWDPDRARALAAAELAVDFGQSFTSRHLQVLVGLIHEVPEQDRTTLQFQTVDLLTRWLLRKGEAVGPDGRIVVGVRKWEEARKIVAAWIGDAFASPKDSKLNQSHKRRGSPVSSQEQTEITPQFMAQSGRPPRLASDFVDFAGALWLKNQHQSPGSRSNAKAQLKATHGELRAMAALLDSEDYVPPAKYLERKAADDVKGYNSRNSNSKTGPIKTWSQLVSVADKDHLRGMRRLLSRCAKKVSSKLLDRVRK